MLAREKQNQLSGKKFPTMREIEFELAIARHTINVAIEEELYHGKNPFSRFDIGPINNERKRVVNDDEYLRLLKESPQHLRPIIITADEMGMRKGEILGAVYLHRATPEDKQEQTTFDIEKGEIHIPRVQRKKTGEREPVMTEILMQVLDGERKKFPECKFVFTGDGKNPIKSFKTSWNNTRRRARSEDVWFHDFRRSDITKNRREGIDITSIKETRGVKTDWVFKRYDPPDKSHAYKVARRDPPKNDPKIQLVTTRGRHYAIWKVTGIKCKCCDFSDMK